MTVPRVLIVVAVCVIGRTLASAADEARTARVVVESSAPPIVFAGEEIRGALQDAGWQLASASADSLLTVVLAEPDGEGEPESFGVSSSGEQGATTVRVRGKDARGVMYGGLDVAEQISLGQEPTTILSRRGTPYLPVRALKFNIPFSGNVYVSKEDQAHGDWFFDLDFWRAFVRYLAYQRYNTLTFWNSHPYGRMVRLNKYPEAAEVPPEELARNIAFFHKLFGLARDHGLDTSLVTWNIHCSAAFQKAHGVKDGQDSELIRDYQKECTRELLAEYPELTGIGTCPGEAMGGTADWRENWIRDTYLAGVAESGRTHVPFIHRYWGSEPAATARMLSAARYPGPVLLDIKFNGEHVYSSTRPHLLEQRWLTQEPRPYKLLWHLRNDCIFQLRWGDPDFAAGVVRSCGGPDSAGFVVGSEVEVPGLDRNHTAESAGHKTWKYEFEKNWTRLGLWGRLGYDPGEPHAYWVAQFCKRFGQEAGPDVFAALQSASKIIPLATSFHWNYMNGDWYPEGNIGGWNTSFEVPFANYRDGKMFHSVVEWIFTHTLDGSLQSIPDYVADLTSGVEPAADVLTPPQVADRLDAAASGCEQLRLSVAERVTTGKGEWDCTAMDLRALEALGHYYAAKVRGATELMRLLATGEETHRAGAVAHLEKALACWQELAAITAAHYVPHEIFLFGQFDWQRYTADAAKDVQIARETVPWQQSRQVWTWQPGQASLTTKCWRADDAAYRGLGNWAAAFNARVAAGQTKTLDANTGSTEASTTLTLDRDGLGVLALRSSGVATARLNGSDCRVLGQPPSQFFVGTVRMGDNHLAVTLTHSATALPFVSEQQILGPDSQFIEAESGELTAPLAIKELAEASGGRVVWAPTGKGRGSDPTTGKPLDNGWITYSVQIPKDADYAIHAFVWWPDGAANSFFYAWDSTPLGILGNDDAFQVWHWIQTKPARLTAGTHTLTVRNREESAVLDCFIVAAQSSDAPDSNRVRDMLTAYYERLSAPHHLAFSSLDDWKQRRAVVTKQVLRDLGLDPLPERLSLNTTYGGNLDRDDYTLRRVYYQTWPDVYASGWLYLPKGPGKHPAVLNPHGHWEHGAMHPIVQTRCIALARKGFVALAVDSVHLPAESFLVGASSIGVMTFDNMRGIDLLQSLPEVDGERIGCVGASGGGQQTMYLMATDDRITAAVPAVMISYFRKIMEPNGFAHCICNVVPAILRDVDEPDLCAAFAPRPAFFTAVTGDWTAHLPTEEFPEIRSVYELYGAAQAVDCAQWEGGHDFPQPMRERVYAFFNRQLKGVDDPAAAAEPTIKTESLETLTALNKPPTGGRGLDAVLDWYKAKFQFHDSAPRDAAGWQGYRQSLVKQVGELLGDVPVKGALVQPPLPATMLGLSGVRLLVQSEPDIQVPAVLLRAAKPGRAPVAVLIHDQGKKAVLDQYGELVRALVSGGAAVLIPEARLTGELARNWPLDTVHWGRPEAGMTVTDLRACLDALATLDEADASRVVLAGLGETGVAALAAGALEPRFQAVLVERVGPLYAEGRKSPLIANIVRVGDLPQLAAAIAPRSVLLASANAARFIFAQEAYQGVDAAAKLELRESAAAPADLARFVLRELGLK